jgi:hypothetical protein
MEEYDTAVIFDAWYGRIAVRVGSLVYLEDAF